MPVLYGCSVQGSYHDCNQDASLLWQQSDLCALVVADGLGSCSRSAEGSQALCAVVRDMAEHEAFLWDDMPATAAGIHARWLKRLQELRIAPCDAYTTCLLVILRNHTAYAFRLGDGFIGMKADGVMHLSFDAKEEYFLNETDCLSERFVPEHWSLNAWKYVSLEGVLLCSDGVDIFCEGYSQEASYERFVTSFIEAYAEKDISVLQTEIPAWLRAWRSSDDRTLVCLLEEGSAEE